MIRLIGSILLLSCSALSSWECRRKQKEKITALSRCLELVEHARMQIEYFSAPLQQIFATFKSGEWKSVEQLCDWIKGSENMEDEEADLMLAWLEGLGGGYKEDQLIRCSFTKEKLSRIAEARKTELANKIKANDVISFLSSISVILLLL